MRIKFYTAIIFFAFTAASLFAGNPDRQGEPGAAELLMLPWARTAGLNGLNVAFVGGTDAMRVNPAGISRIMNTEISVGSSDYLRATDTKMNALGIAQRIGKNKDGAIGFSIMALDFGQQVVRTNDNPEGTGATFTPVFFNIGLGYSKSFEDKIFVGFTARMISESTSDVAALGIGFDAGVQYVSGEDDNFNFGISLRNVGTKMNFDGEGLALRVDPEGQTDQLIVRQNPTAFELPTQLNVGVSYDFYASSKKHKITVLGAFTGNSFGRDQVGGGVEYSFKNFLQLRGSYEIEVGSDDLVEINNVYSGLAAGASVLIPLSKGKDSRLSIDYAYRATEVFDGTHNFGVTVKL